MDFFDHEDFERFCKAVQQKAMMREGVQNKILYLQEQLSRAKEAGDDWHEFYSQIKALNAYLSEINSIEVW